MCRARPVRRALVLSPSTKATMLLLFPPRLSLITIYQVRRRGTPKGPETAARRRDAHESKRHKPEATSFDVCETRCAPWYYRKATVSFHQLSSAQLRSAPLRSAPLRSAPLRSAQLRSAPLSSPHEESRCGTNFAGLRSPTALSPAADVHACSPTSRRSKQSGAEDMSMDDDR